MISAETTVNRKKAKYISSCVIAKIRSKFSKTEKGYAPKACTTLIAFEYENSIVFLFRCLSSFDGSWSTHASYSFVRTKNKKGEQKFRFYKFKGKAVYTASPISIGNELAALSNKSVKPSSVYIKRIKKIVTAFLRRHSVNTKYMSKNPFGIMIQLCYPGMAGFDDNTLSKIAIGRYLLDDPVKFVLRTNGKASKRLLFAAIKRSPSAAQSIAHIAKWLRINRSLDEAQKFLEQVAARKVSCSLYHRNINVRLARGLPRKKIDARFLPVEFFNLFANTPSTDFCYFIQHDGTNILIDTLCMLDQLSHDNQFNLENLRYRNLVQLHDQLAAFANRRRRAQILDFRPVPCTEGFPEKFEENSHAMQASSWLSKSLNEKFDDIQFVYPSTPDELGDMAAQMHNCAAFYTGRIIRNEYIIVCIKDKKDEKLFGMLGFTMQLRDIFVPVDTALPHFSRDRPVYAEGAHSVNFAKTQKSWLSAKISLDQAVTYCNESLAEHPSFNAIVNVIENMKTPLGPSISISPFITRLAGLVENDRPY